MQVEILRRKMEGLSRGFLLERMKEYGSLLSAENSSIASSASTSRRTEASNPSSPVLKPLQAKTLFLICLVFLHSMHVLVIDLLGR